MNPPYLCTEKKRKEGKGVEGRQRKETGVEEREVYRQVTRKPEHLLYTETREPGTSSQDTG